MFRDDLIGSQKCISERRVQSHQSLSVPVTIIKKLYMCNLMIFNSNNHLDHCRDQRSD